MEPTIAFVLQDNEDLKRKVSELNVALDRAITWITEGEECPPWPHILPENCPCIGSERRKECWIKFFKEV